MPSPKSPYANENPRSNVYQKKRLDQLDAEAMPAPAAPKRQPINPPVDGDRARVINERLKKRRQMLDDL